MQTNERLCLHNVQLFPLIYVDLFFFSSNILINKQCVFVDNSCDAQVVMDTFRLDYQL